MDALKYKKNKSKYILLAPIIILYSLFIGGGLINVIIESTGFIPTLGLNKISSTHYLEIIRDKSFLMSLGYSLYIAFTSASISTFIGVLIAYKMVITKNRFWAKITKKILQLGIILPYLYMVFLTIIILGRTGFISRIFINLGLILSLEEFPRLIFEPYGIGIIVVYVLKGIAFVSLFVVNIMGNISTTFNQVAKTLGANEKNILKKVYLPLSCNAIVWTSSIIFVYYFGAYEVSYLLGSNRFVPLSSKLYSLYIDPHITTIPSAMAMNIIMLVMGSIAVIIYSMILKRILRGGLR